MFSIYGCPITQLSFALPEPETICKESPFFTDFTISEMKMFSGTFKSFAIFPLLCNWPNFLTTVSFNFSGTCHRALFLQVVGWHIRFSSLSQVELPFSFRTNR